MRTGSFMWLLRGIILWNIMCTVTGYFINIAVAGFCRPLMVWEVSTKNMLFIAQICWFWFEIMADLTQNVLLGIFPMPHDNTNKMRSFISKYYWLKKWDDITKMAQDQGLGWVPLGHGIKESGMGGTWGMKERRYSALKLWAWSSEINFNYQTNLVWQAIENTTLICIIV